MKLVGLSSMPERPSGGRLIYRFDFRFSGRHLSFRLQLDEILKDAFGLADWELAGPKWLDENVYEVDAIMPQGTTKDDAPRMVQALLRERFGLRYHTEARDIRANALVVGKRGFPLKPVTATGHPSVGHGMRADGKFHLTATEATIDYLAG